MPRSPHEWGVAVRGGLVLAAGLAVGLAGLVHYDKLIAARRAARALRLDPVSVPVGAPVGAPGAPAASGAQPGPCQRLVSSTRPACR